MKVQLADIESRVTDVYGRSFKTLRVSLTESCNFACTYCVAADGQSIKASYSDTAYKDLIRTIEDLHKVLNLDTVRLTGGEPTLYKGLIQLVKELSVFKIPVKLTTNGFLLPSMAAPLARAGLSSINVSLDAVEEDIFFLITRRKTLSNVLKGIDAASNEGIEVKINSVIMKGINDKQILPLFAYAKSRNISIRFLELMKMGHLFSSEHLRYYFSQEEILSEIKQRYFVSDLGRGTSATAHYRQTSDGYRFGIIANESAPFCNDCDRLRLDSNGNIYGCLSSNQNIPLKNLNSKELLSALNKALSHKQPASFTGSKLSMMDIGG